MFKKLKDKLAEEVKSSPQRIQQFAQAAQAAVTSASSSISDITNSDLFSIGDNDNPQARSGRTQQSSSSQPHTFQDAALVQPTTDPMEYSHEIVDAQRQRRLSNSSFASDVSFRLPNYETPSMYHLQSDMEVSASEADERGFSAGPATLDRVTKEQLYAAYKHTQERYTKYRTQYGDLARHYKLLERENAKARSVLVETQDKALRRISELKEQCALEQSAKAHLEKALRIDIEEKNLKIDALNTKVHLLQINPQANKIDGKNENMNNEITDVENDAPLINLVNDNVERSTINETSGSEVLILNNKIEKMEHLMNKYKESLKTIKEKNSQTITELQKVSNELEQKNKENDELKISAEQLNEANKKIQELNDINETLQNKINAFDFIKTKELSTLEIDLQKAQEEIADLQSKIEVFSKREEEYAISLAENKLSIHKELESKEAEIKSLKDTLSASKKELQSLSIVVNEYKNSRSLMEEEQSKLKNELNELNNEIGINKNKMKEVESQLQDYIKNNQNLEHLKTKLSEEYKCLQMQMKQETAEKLAMIDRNDYLENRNAQLTEENVKKSSHISNLESELNMLNRDDPENDNVSEEIEKKELIEELQLWKEKNCKLELEIQEEREELIKLQTEIEKLLTNHELIQSQNSEFRNKISLLTSENAKLQECVLKYIKMKSICKKLANDVNEMQHIISLTSKETKSFAQINKEMFSSLIKEMKIILNTVLQKEVESLKAKYNNLKLDHTCIQNELTDINKKYEDLCKNFNSLQEENNKLNSSIKEYDLDNTLTTDKMQIITDQYNVALNELNSLKNEKHDLMSQIEESENKFQRLYGESEKDKEHHLAIIDQLNTLKSEKEDSIKQLKILEDKNTLLSKELKQLHSQQKVVVDKIDILNKENDELKSKLHDFDSKIVYSSELEQTVRHLSQENASLKSQAENIAHNVKSLEGELNDVRKSHEIIEIEKDRLSQIIENMQGEEHKNISNRQNKYTSTNEESFNLEDELLNKKSELNNFSNKTLSHFHSLDEETNIAEKYNQMKIDIDVIKEEKRRLQSDIEGLQTYLTKISKENSALNDKLREYIATSEHSPDNYDLSSDVKTLRNEVQISKDKIDDLLRENTLLIEENLELKDQLQSQNYPRGTDFKSIAKNENSYDKKYNDLLQANSEWEQKYVDLEQMNRSVSGNMLHIQEKNEKLKLTNEKLERRLDEALVSLRHLHSLQENTELEYLRNILYEYLTGSGMHSVTLAKVLSAIVKFDDSQTQMVLQKEKERQGILRQLGII